jgi:hypothetical protein
MEAFRMKHSASTKSRKRRAVQARRLRTTMTPTLQAADAAITPATLTLAQQNADLTAEGSPPPGKVGLEPPVTPQARAAKASRPLAGSSAGTAAEPR